MTITREYIAEIRLAAQYSDDHREYHREMARAARLEAMLEEVQATPAPKVEPVPRRPTGRLVADSIAHAIELMERRGVPA